MQAGAVDVEAPEREAALGAGLQQSARVAAGRERDRPVRPALSRTAQGLGALDARQAARVVLGGERQARRQLRARRLLVALEDLAALGQQQQPVAEPLGVLHHMRREDHRGAGLGALQHHLLQHRLVHRVEAGEGLVQDQQARVCHQGGGQLHLLRHALRQLLDLAVGEGGQAEAVEQAPRRALGVVAAHTLQPAEIDHGLQHRHLAVEAALLRQEADVAAAPLAGRAAQHLDRPAGGPQDVERHAQRRGLARAIGAQETEDAALGDIEAQVIDGGEVFEALGDAV